MASATAHFINTGDNWGQDRRFQHHNFWAAESTKRKVQLEKCINSASALHGHLKHVINSFRPQRGIKALSQQALSREVIKHMLTLIQYPKCLESNRVSQFVFCLSQNTHFCWKRLGIGLKAVNMYAQKTEFSSEDTTESASFLKTFTRGPVLRNGMGLRGANAMGQNLRGHRENTAAGVCYPPLNHELEVDKALVSLHNQRPWSSWGPSSTLMST